MPARPITGCVTLGRLFTSLCLFLFICKMVLVIVCSHLLGLLRSSQEAWGPASLSPSGNTRSHVQCSLASRLHLARGQQELHRKEYLRFKSFSFKKAYLGYTSSGKPPPFPEAHSESCLNSPSLLLAAGLATSSKPVSSSHTFFVFKNLMSYAIGAI